MVASMRNVVVGATVAATSVSFVYAGKPALFQATAGTQKFCSDPSFKTDGNSFTKPGTPDAVSVNNPSGYFMVPEDKYLYYVKPNTGYTDGDFKGFDFLSVSGMCAEQKILTDARCVDYNDCDQTIKQAFHGQDACGVTDDSGATKLSSYITPWGLSNWHNVADHDCCPYDQVFEKNLSEYFGKFLGKYSGEKWSNCDKAFSDFLNDWTEGRYDVKKCKYAYKAFQKDPTAICDIKPASVF